MHGQPKLINYLIIDVKVVIHHKLFPVAWIDRLEKQQSSDIQGI